MIHFDAHADTGDIEFGSLYGHGQPMRRLIESGALRGDRFLQIGLRGYWPGPETLAWMAEQRMRSYEMTEIVARGLDACLDEAFEIALDDCDAVFLSVDIDVCDPGHAPGTGTPEPGGLSARGAARRRAPDLPRAARSPASTWSRCRRPTTTPRSPPSSPTGSASRRSRGWPPGGAASTTTPPGRCSRGAEMATATRFRGGTLFDGEHYLGSGEVLVADGRVVEVRRLDRGAEPATTGPGEEVVDLRGGLLAPGFVDAHVHPIQGGLERLRCDLSDLSTREEYLAAIRAYADAHPDLPWILGGGWAMPAFPGGTPTAADLDARRARVGRSSCPTATTTGRG